MKQPWDGNILGPTLNRIVVIADGHFWFEIDDFEVMERSVAIARLGRIEVWVRREHGSELYQRTLTRPLARRLAA